MYKNAFTGFYNILLLFALKTHFPTQAKKKHGQKMLYIY